MNDELFSMVLKLLLAGGLGALIGIEREAHGRPAGLRTHILVSLGAALFTIVSQSYRGPTADPSRIASQIVSGIGFLGAGTIIRQGSIIRGLTTAASLWTTAAIGMAVGAGGILAYLATVASVIVFATLGFISQVERVMISRQEWRDLIVTLPGGRAGLASVLEMLTGFGVSVLGVQVESAEPDVFRSRLRLRLRAGVDAARISHELTTLPEVESFEWE